MKIGHKIDSNGFLIVDVLSDSQEIPDVTLICPDGFYKPKWSGTQWIEGLTLTQIDTIKNTPKKPISEERLAALEAAMLSQMGL